MLADYHIHTHLSNDSDYPYMDCIRRYIDLGFDEICLTEHTDYFDSHDLYVPDYEECYRFYKQANAQYGDQITIKFGMEFGIQPHEVHHYPPVFSEWPFDFIILSNHEIDDLEYHTGEFQEGRTQQDYYQAYYEATLDIMKRYTDYSVLGHVDVIKRYDSLPPLTDDAHEDIIRAILAQAVKDDKGIEVNTSCFRYNMGDLTPSTTILRWYQEAGGKILTIGSDSHAEEHAGAYIPQVKEQLKDMGFDTFCTYTKMVPTFHKL